jgi:hypothetical protein
VKVMQISQSTQPILKLAQQQVPVEEPALQLHQLEH